MPPRPETRRIAISIKIIDTIALRISFPNVAIYDKLALNHNDCLAEKQESFTRIVEAAITSLAYFICPLYENQDYSRIQRLSYVLFILN